MGLTNPEIVYALPRADTEQVAEGFVAGTPAILLLSHFNGKTMLADAVKLKASEHFKVVEFLKGDTVYR